jgi:hypothetical protein
MSRSTLAASPTEVLNEHDAQMWLFCVRHGDFEGAWDASDRIRQRATTLNDVSQPRHVQQIWDGRDITDQRVLIRCYHGLGDTIQFIRYVPMVKAHAREVIVWAQPSLMTLLRDVKGIDRLLPLHDGTPETGYDVDIEIMELPYVFRTTLSTIPADVPYLMTCPRLLDGRRPRVGIVWRGGEWDDRRAVPFDLLTPVLEMKDISWYRLQHPMAAYERHPNLIPLDCDGIGVTAEYMRAMDLVISIDSMAAHLAGALAVPVWTLLSSDADWRWMEGRCDSPWYPTMRLFRQDAPGDWDGVMEAVRERLLLLQREY